jgi:hypothetical protein
MSDSLKITGTVTLKLFDKDGNLKQEGVVNNLVTTAGKNLIARKVISDSEVISSIGIGSGVTTPTVTDTALTTELANIELLYQMVDAVETNSIVFVTTFEENVGTGTINEVGLFSDSSPQKLVCHALVSPAFVKESTDYVNVSWKLTLE